MATPTPKEGRIPDGPFSSEGPSDVARQRRWEHEFVSGNETN